MLHSLAEGGYIIGNEEATTLYRVAPLAEGGLPRGKEVVAPRSREDFNTGPGMLPNGAGNVLY